MTAEPAALAPLVDVQARRRWRTFADRSTALLLGAAARSSVAITVGIVAVLVLESAQFFGHVGIGTFLTDTVWTPLFADPRFGILPLVCGTMVTTVVALAVAIPLGTIVAI